MKAVILAGGFGTRLYPITDKLPKPMVPVLGEPAMAHIITWLCKNGIYDAAVTLKYMPEQMIKAFNDCYCGVNLKYYTEDEPLGTAGGVKNAAEFFDGDIVVVSGDCICDFDLKAAYEFHRNKNAHLTVLLKTVEDPLSFGTALCDNEGRIKSFSEKPSWQQVKTNAVNTGIYIFNKNLLQLIPEGKFFDFSKDLFPYLLEKNFRVYGYEATGDWCDIGSLEEYRKCNIEALHGKYSLYSSVKPRENCYDSVISETAVLGADTQCIASVVHEGVRIGRGCTVTGSVICRDAIIGDGVRIESGCVIGSAAIIADNTHIFEDVIIPCDTKINGEEKSMKIKSGRLFSDDGIEGDFYSFFDIETITELGRAVGLCSERVGVMSDGVPMCRLAADAFLCGVRYGGCDGYRLDDAPYTACGTAARTFGLDLCVHASLAGDGRVRLGFYDEDGLSPDKTFEDKVVKALYSKNNGEFHKPGELKNLGGADELYESLVLSQGTGLEGISVCLSEHMYTMYFARILQKAGVKVIMQSEREENTVYADISSDLKSITVKQGNKFDSKPLDFYRLRAVVLNFDKSISRVALTYGMPSDLEKTALKNGIKTEKILTCPTMLTRKDREQRRIWYKNPWMYDPLCCLVRVLNIMKKTGSSLEELDGQIGEFSVREELIKTDDGGKGRVLKALYERNLKENDGYSESATVFVKRGEASILPTRSGLRILIRSRNAEIASALAEDVKTEIEKFVNK